MSPGNSEKLPMIRIFALLGGINAFLAVALGAFGAHALRSHLTPDLITIYQTGVQYHLIHALGLLSIAALYEPLGQNVLVRWSGWLLVAGIFLFSGSLYALALSGMRLFGAITPLGGVCFLAGWALLVVGTIQQRWSV